MSLREIKQRIGSVKTTLKITSAMKMVSAAKLHRAQSAIEGVRPYQRKLDSIFSAFVTSLPAGNIFTAKRDVKRVAIVAVASNSTMCGGFNSNVTKLMRSAVEEYRAAGAEAARKLCFAPDTSLLAQAGAPQYAEVAQLAAALMERFGSSLIDRVELIYTSFGSVSKLVPVREQFLPFTTAEDGDTSTVTDYIIEPGKAELADALLPKVISLRLYTALLDSAAAEHAARMIAMQIATENANDLISELTLEYNKGRQQEITSELQDIIAGSAGG